MLNLSGYAIANGVNPNQNVPFGAWSKLFGNQILFFIKRKKKIEQNLKDLSIHSHG